VTAEGDPRLASDAVSEPAVVIVSGLSGAGKTAAAKLFEDLGYNVVDNLPGELLPDLAELVSSDRERFARVAIVLDVRAGDAALALAAMRGALEGRGIRPRVVFLEASDDVLIRRFSETRHPRVATSTSPCMIETEPGSAGRCRETRWRTIERPEHRGCCCREACDGLLMRCATLASPWRKARSADRGSASSADATMHSS